MNSKRVIVGIIFIIAGIVPVLFVGLTQSNVIWGQDDMDGWDFQSGPKTVQLTKGALQTQSYIVAVGCWFAEYGQGRHVGPINFTSSHGGKYSLSYDLWSESSYAEWVFATDVWNLPDDTYTVNVADTVVWGSDSPRNLDYFLVNAGPLHDLSNPDPSGQDSNEAGALYGTGLLAFALAAIGITLIVKGAKDSDSGAGYGQRYQRPTAYIAPASPRVVRPLASPASPIGEPSISSAELNLISQAALKKAVSQPPTSSGEMGDTRPCPSCGNPLRTTAKFCNVCGHKL